MNIKQQYKNKILYSEIIIVFLILFIRPIGSMLFLPSLPALQTYFCISQACSQLSITVYVTALGISQLIYGPLSDRFGRKKILFSGLVLFLIGSVLSIFALNIQQFLFFRALQGIGLGCDFSITSGILADMLPSNNTLAKIESLGESIFGFSVLIFPFAGGYIQHYLGWKYQFVIMAIYSLILIILFSFFLQETHKKPLQKNISKIFNFFSFKYLGLLLVLFIMNGFFFSFCSISSTIAQSKLGISSYEYGIFIMITGGAYITGTISNFILLKTISEEKLCTFGLCLYLLGCFIALVALLSRYENSYSLFIPVIIATFSTGFIVPQVMAKLLLFFPEQAATSGSIIGFIYFFGQGSILGIVTFLKVESMQSITIFMFITWITMIIGFYIFNYTKLHCLKIFK